MTNNTTSTGVRWEPLPDGEYDGQHRNHTIVVDGEWLKIAEMALPSREIVEAEMALVETIRLCRAVAVPAESLDYDETQQLMVDAATRLIHSDTEPEMSLGWRLIGVAAAKFPAESIMPDEIRSTIVTSLMHYRLFPISTAHKNRINATLEWVHTQFPQEKKNE
jgi:hypothetical protein